MSETALEKKHDNFQLITSEDVRKHFCENATEKEVAMFLKICELNQLSPFKREAYLVKYGTYPASILTGYEVYLKRAERSGQWNGFKVWVEGTVPNLVAKIEVYRKDWDKPLYHEIDYSEYVQTKKDGNANNFWATKPKTMLKKVAISQGLRMAFPDELAGLPYTQEEFYEQEAEPAAKPQAALPLRKSATAHPDSQTPDAKTATDAYKPQETTTQQPIPSVTSIDPNLEPPTESDAPAAQPEPVSGDFKEITAKYKGMCKGCDGPIEPGQKIRYSKSRGNFHLTCGNIK